MSDLTKAVFLSYASQDAEAAKRICEALRTAGVEVWFDQNELVGGDAWDAKIRGQIASCALFVPLISANTQARLEGYFRREWKQAAGRTHDMADEKAFLLPVVIDDTRDAEAKVPAEFKAVQWTRLPGGETPEKFCARVKKLLNEELVDVAPGGQGAGGGGHGVAGPSRENPKAGARHGRLGRLWWALPIFGVTMAMILVLKEGRKEPATVAVPAPKSEAQQLVAQVWAELARIHLDPPILTAAEGLARRAAALEPLNPETWAAWSQVDSWCGYMQYDSSPQRIESARANAEHALRLAPDAFEARLAQAVYLVRAHGEVTLPPDAAQAESLLNDLLKERPDEPRTLFTAAILQRNLKHWGETRSLFMRLARNPAFAAAAWAELGYVEQRAGDPVAAEAAADRSIQIQPYATNLTLKLYLAMDRGDFEAAEATLGRIPSDISEEDKVVSIAARLGHWRRDPKAMLQRLDRISREWLHSVDYDGPIALWIGCARQMAGQKEAARFQWELALNQVERRLEDHPSSGALIRWKGVFQALLDQKRESEKNLQLASQLKISPREGPPQSLVIHARILNGQADAVIDELEAIPLKYWIKSAYFRFDPFYDLLRSNPRFQLLQAKLESEAAPPKITVAEPLAQADAKSVAVLAFANLSDDKANEYFSDGISEELLNVLAKIPGLKVTARTSSFFFKGKEVPIPEIARQLGVAFVIEGSVRKAGDKVRITAQMIKAADGFHVWSDTFTRDLKDVFAVQDEIAGLIAQQLQLKLGGSSRANKQVNPEGYDLYLRARALSRLEDEDFAPMIKLYEAAVAKDPEFVLAHVQLSLIRGYDYWAGGLDSKPAARAALQAAQRLAPDAPETRLAAGSYAYSCENDWNLARTEFLAAEAGLPGDAQVAFYLGMVQRRLLSLDESVRQVARAIDLDPGDRNNYIQQAHSLKALRRYAQLRDLMTAALKRFPVDADFLNAQALAQCELDHDGAALRRRRQELPVSAGRNRILTEYRLALDAGEWEAAGRLLDGTKLDYVANTPASTKDPLALQQAMLAHIQGQTKQAQRFGTEALAYYQTQHWSLRQDKWLRIGWALALAYAGRGEEAVSIARDTLAANTSRDPWDAIMLHSYVAHVYLVAGRLDEAFAELRIMMTGPCLQGPEELRRDPLWRTVKDDPRFEEILRSAKQL